MPKPIVSQQVVNQLNNNSVMPRKHYPAPGQMPEDLSRVWKDGLCDCPGNCPACWNNDRSTYPNRTCIRADIDAPDGLTTFFNSRAHQIQEHRGCFVAAALNIGQKTIPIKSTKTTTTPKQPAPHNRHHNSSPGLQVKHLQVPTIPMIVMRSRRQKRKERKKPRRGWG